MDGACHVMHLAPVTPVPVPTEPEQLQIPVWTVLVGIWVVIGVVVITALIKVWPVISKGVETINALTDLPLFIKRFEKIEQDVSDIRHEVFPNSGKSMRDKIDRTANRLDEHIDSSVQIIETLIRSQEKEDKE